MVDPGWYLASLRHWAQPFTVETLIGHL